MLVPVHSQHPTAYIPPPLTCTLRASHADSRSTMLRPHQHSRPARASQRPLCLHRLHLLTCTLSVSHADSRSTMLVPVHRLAVTDRQNMAMDRPSAEPRDWSVGWGEEKGGGRKRRVYSMGQRDGAQLKKDVNSRLSDSQQSRAGVEEGIQFQAQASQGWFWRRQARAGSATSKPRLALLLCCCCTAVVLLTAVACACPHAALRPALPTAFL